MKVTTFYAPIAVAVLIAAVMVLARPAFSQEQVDKKKMYGSQTEEYCTVFAVGKAFSTKWKVEVDFGQKFEWNLKNKDLLRDQKGNLIKFNSPVDAINFLNASGWTVVSAFGDDEYLAALMKRSIRE